MNRGFLCEVLLVVVSVTTPCQGERIVFSAKPTTISPGVTPKLTVRCALEADGNSQNSVNRVNTIVIRRAEGSIQREVARIAHGKAATAGSWATGAIVTGDLSNNVGYLQANWSSPGHVQAGKYNCEIVALETDGTNIKFKSNIQVDSTGQNVDSLEASIAQCKQDIEALKKVVGDGQKGFDDLKITVGDGQREFDYLKKTVNELKTTISSLSSVHNEEGTVLCFNSDSWGARFTERETVKEVRFSTPYARNPQVVISPVSLDVEKIMNLRYRIGIRDLTATGFKIACGTWWDTLLYHIEVRWTSSVA